MVCHWNWRTGLWWLLISSNLLQGSVVLLLHFFSLFSVLLEFLVWKVVSVVEHLFKDAYCVSFVEFMVLHVSVPQEVGHLVWDHNLVRLFVAHIQKFEILLFIGLEAQNSSGKLHGELVLSDTGLNEPIFVLLVWIVQRVEFEDAVNRCKFAVLSVKVDDILEIGVYELL
jgi:hypothetical protein